MISLATSLIPFLEHDDANRALMGSNMQRQAVPLLITERAFVGTGLELHAVRDSTTLCISQISGQVNYIDANKVCLTSSSLLTGPEINNDGMPHNLVNNILSGYEATKPYASEKLAKISPTIGHTQSEYFFQKYWRSNQSTCIYQKPQVKLGDWINTGTLLGDGAGSSYGDIALGRNILVAYMPWEGFNFEDAIVINERLVSEDIYTSIHIERYDVDVRETEYGKEQILRDVLGKPESLYTSTASSLYGSIRPTEESLGREIISKNTCDEVVASPLTFGPTSIGGATVTEGIGHAIEYGSGYGSGGATTSSHSADSVTESSTTSQAIGRSSGPTPTSKLDKRGIIYPGTWVEDNDILVGKITPIAPPKPSPEYRLLLAIFETKPLPYKDSSLRVPMGVHGRVLDCIVTVTECDKVVAPPLPYPLQGRHKHGEGEFDYGARKINSNSNNSVESLDPALTQIEGCVQSVQVFIASKRKIQLGDKMSGRHGNKGIVSLILAPQDMPFLQDGTAVDIVLNPLGVPSRMNVGQVLECLFGLASFYLSENYRLIPFDEIYGDEASRGLIYTKLLEAASSSGYEWLFDPNHPGKTHLFDGRTGEPFHQPVLVGYSYILKLIHQVDEKMHARSTGPYSLITQQPLGGRSKHGGQRLGEMEVWALEGFGSASVLHEFLTLKSDDIDSRNTFLFYLMKRKNSDMPEIDNLESCLISKIEMDNCGPDQRRKLRRSSGYGTTSSHAAAVHDATVATVVDEIHNRADQSLVNKKNDLGPDILYVKRALPLYTSDVVNGMQQSRSSGRATTSSHSADVAPLYTIQTRVPESFRVLVHELQSLCLSVYFNPEFRLTYPSLLGWDGLFLLPSKSTTP
jgi:DNA-directed RNA polymerase subunit beta